MNMNLGSDEIKTVVSEVFRAVSGFCGESIRSSPVSKNQETIGLLLKLLRNRVSLLCLIEHSARNAFLGIEFIFVRNERYFHSTTACFSGNFVCVEKEGRKTCFLFRTLLDLRRPCVGGIFPSLRNSSVDPEGSSISTS